MNLSRRFKNYFSISFLETRIQKNKSMIYKALLKYGYSIFTIEILEYCDPKDLIKREQYYIDLLKPEYNILKIAGSRLGSIHTIESRAKMSSSKAGEKHPMFGKYKPRPEGAGRPYQKIEVIDIKNNITTRYDSITAAALALNIRKSTISNYLARNDQKFYKKRYAFKKVN